MAHKTLIDGTAYEVSGGRTLVDGTGYDISGGRTLMDGTGYDIPLSSELLVYDGADDVLTGTLTIGNISWYGGMVSVPPACDSGGIYDGVIRVGSASQAIPAGTYNGVTVTGGAGRNIYYATIGPIDISKYNTLYVEGYGNQTLTANSVTSAGTFGLATNPAVSSTTYSASLPTCETYGALASTSSAEYSLDISSYSGDYYIQLNPLVYTTGSFYAYYSKIWLTKD